MSCSGDSEFLYVIHVHGLHLEEADDHLEALGTVIVPVCSLSLSVYFQVYGDGIALLFHSGFCSLVSLIKTVTYY